MSLWGQETDRHLRSLNLCVEGDSNSFNLATVSSPVYSYRTSVIVTLLSGFAPMCHIGPRPHELCPIFQKCWLCPLCFLY